MLNLVLGVKIDLNFLLRVIDQCHRPMGLSSHFGDSEVNILVLDPFELKFQRDTLSFYLDNDFVQSVNIKY